jgi:hypothetical protein
MRISPVCNSPVAVRPFILSEAIHFFWLRLSAGKNDFWSKMIISYS